MRSNMTGIGYHNSEPRIFNRGFGRGISKPFQQSQHHPSPQPPRRGGDLFMEAGRLAVDYLISRGVLSSNVLSGKYQNGSLRKELDDQRNYSRERSGLRPSGNYSSDLTCENEREGSMSEKQFQTKPVEVNNDARLNDTTSQDASTNDDKHSEVQDDARKGCIIDDLDSKTTSLLQNKDDMELVKHSDENGFEETKIDADDHDKEKDTITDDLASQQSKSDSLLISEENNVSATGLDSLDTKNYDDKNDSEEIPCSKSLDSGVFGHSFGEGGVVNPGYPINEQKPIELLSFSEKTFSYEEKPSGLPELGMFCSSIGKDRGEKRSIEENNSMEGAKKAKQQWLSVAQSDVYSHLSDLSDKHSVSPTRNDGQSNINGEKELLSNSFKIFDLNIMEASDTPENHETPLLYSKISGPSQDIMVDIDLSMRSNIRTEYNASGSMGKEIEIIDLESESLEECKSSNTSIKNNEAGLTTIECFSNQQNTTENPDAQDGYGFMISELLGNEVPNCSSVQPDMNSLHNNMGLNHTEGMFGEDDPIYMSLGEIPLTGLLRAWEQPTQERNPFEL